jgi:hypothetical protein
MEILSANALAPHAQDFGSNSEWQVLINKLTHTLVALLIRFVSH